MNEKKAVSLIGISMKAGRVASGEFAVEKALKEGRASLVVIAGDASENSRTKFLNKAAWYKVPAKIFGSREELGRIIGKAERAALAITDPGLAERINDHLSDDGERSVL